MASFVANGLERHSELNAAQQVKNQPSWTTWPIQEGWWDYFVACTWEISVWVYVGNTYIFLVFARRFPGSYHCERLQKWCRWHSSSFHRKRYCRYTAVDIVFLQRKFVMWTSQHMLRPVTIFISWRKPGKKNISLYQHYYVLLWDRFRLIWHKPLLIISWL